VNVIDNSFFLKPQALTMASNTALNFFVYTNVPKVANDRICPICSEEAPPGEAHHPHYGGICCYSCRAFFRRANQRTKTPQLKCRNSKNFFFFLQMLLQFSFVQALLQLSHEAAFL
jgi:hypothetical protein